MASLNPGTDPCAQSASILRVFRRRMSRPPPELPLARAGWRLRAAEPSARRGRGRRERSAGSASAGSAAAQPGDRQNKRAQLQFCVAVAGLSGRF